MVLVKCGWKLTCFNMFHVFALTYYILLCCVTRRDARVQYDVITRAVHETCFCCRSCKWRFCSHLHLVQFAALCGARVQFNFFFILLFSDIRNEITTIFIFFKFENKWKEMHGEKIFMEKFRWKRLKNHHQYNTDELRLMQVHQYMNLSYGSPNFASFIYSTQKFWQFWSMKKSKLTDGSAKQRRNSYVKCSNEVNFGLP